MGGRDAGGVGGLLRLFCCRNHNQSQQCQYNMLDAYNSLLTQLQTSKAIRSHLVGQLGVIVRDSIK